jgi:hypothetical protein
MHTSLLNESRQPPPLHLRALTASTGVLLVNSCGFDSIPAEAGAAYGAGMMSAAGYLPTAIDSFVALTGGPAGLAVHYATYESAVHGFGSADELRAIRRRYAAAQDAGGGATASSSLPLFGRRLARHDGLFFDARTGAYAFPFLGADASIVRRTQRTGVATGALAARPEPSAGVTAALPLQYAAYVTLPSAWVAALFLAYGTAFTLLARFSLGRRLLLAFPRLFTHGLFSHEGPTRAQIAGARFAMTFFVQGEQASERGIGREETEADALIFRSRAAHALSPGRPSHPWAAGYSAALAPAVLAAPSTSASKSGGSSSSAAAVPPKPDVHAVVRVSGPEPGYDATSRMVVACALTVLEEGPAMVEGRAAGCGPGVLTPGAAFRGTRLVQRLQAAGIKFEVLQAPGTVPTGGAAGR